MLLNPVAVKKLKDVTAFNYWPYTTHEQRNELARMFNEEAGRLLDQKAESVVKHTVEIYSKGEISYERYIELIEQVSKEEATRGATYGEEYASNRVFDFAQKALDRAKDQAHALSLTEAKKQYEIEKRKSEQSIQDILQHSVTTIEMLTQQQDVEIKTIVQKEKEAFIHDQESTIEHTKTEIEHIISGQLQDERDRREREIREQEDLRPARVAAQTAIARVALLEKKGQAQRRVRNIFMALGLGVLLCLLLLLIFFSPPQWISAILLIVMTSLFGMAFFWRSTVIDEKIAADKRQIALYQTKSDGYSTPNEEDRCALLVQRLL